MTCKPASSPSRVAAGRDGAEGGLTRLKARRGTTREALILCIMYGPMQQHLYFGTRAPHVRTMANSTTRSRETRATHRSFDRDQFSGDSVGARPVFSSFLHGVSFESIRIGTLPRWTRSVIFYSRRSHAGKQLFLINGNSGTNVFVGNIEFSGLSR